VPRLSESSPFALPQFVAGPENHMVEVAVAALLAEPVPAYNPLMLFGSSGTGKTHLATGLYHSWKVRYPRRPAVLTTGSDFAREFREAAETKTEDQFDSPYVRARLLVLDNIDELATRQGAQRALIALLDRTLAAGGWVVATARTSPGRIEGLLPALQARLTGGLALRLALPSAETRFVILDRVSRLRQMNVSKAVLETLADGLAAPVAELVGALVQLEGQSRLEGTLITVADAVRLLAGRQETRRPRLSQIAKATSKYFGVSVADLRGPSRQRAIVTARIVAMYLARNLTQKSLEAIGDYFGQRDHTTVSYGCRKAEERLKTDTTVREAIAELQAKLLLR